MKNTSFVFITQCSKYFVKTLLNQLIVLFHIISIGKNILVSYLDTEKLLLQRRGVYYFAAICYDYNC